MKASLASNPESEVQSPDAPSGVRHSAALPDAKRREPPESKLRTRFLLALKIIISAALLLWLSRRVSMAEAVAHLLHLNAAMALLALALLGLSHFLSGMRWHLASARALPLPLCLRFTWVAQLYALILPGALSSDVAKGVLITTRREMRCGITLSASIVIDRIAGLGSLLVFGLLSCLARPGLVPFPPLLLISGAVAVSVLLVAFPGLLRRLLPLIDRSCRLPRLHDLSAALDWRTWFQVLGLSTAIHAVNISFYQSSLAAVGGHESWLEMALYTCLLNLAMLLPVSIGGVGLREQIAVSLFQSSANAPVQVAFGWLVFMLSLVHGLIGLGLQWRRPVAGHAAAPPTVA